MIDHCDQHVIYDEDCVLCQDAMRRKRQSESTTPISSSVIPDVPKLSETIKRMCNQETLVNIEMNVQHAKELIGYVDESTKTHQWDRTIEFLIILKWKTESITAQCKSLINQQKDTIQNAVDAAEKSS